jgi:hypothetical protein
MPAHGAQVKNVADIEDEKGAWVRVDIIPGYDVYAPKLIMVTIKDEQCACVQFTPDQLSELIDGLQNALWECH